MRRRGELIERSFAHLYDTLAMRRTGRLCQQQQFATDSFRLKEKRRAGLISQPASENTAAPARDLAKSTNEGIA